MSWRERDEGEREYQRRGYRTYDNPYDRYGDYDERRRADDFDYGQRYAERRAEERREEEEMQERQERQRRRDAEISRQQEDHEYDDQQERESENLEAA